jgi:hypothetical protein
MMEGQQAATLDVLVRAFGPRIDASKARRPSRRDARRLRLVAHLATQRRHTQFELEGDGKISRAWIAGRRFTGRAFLGMILGGLAKARVPRESEAGLHLAPALSSAAPDPRAAPRVRGGDERVLAFVDDLAALAVELFGEGFLGGKP